MASSSSNTSSTSSSSSPTSTSPAAPAASAGLFGGVAPGASASASATALGFATGAIASATALGVARGAIASASATAPGAARLNLAPVFSVNDFPPLAAPRRSQNSASLSTLAPVMSSYEEGSSSASSAWSAPSPSSTTVASTPTDTRTASTASSSTTPSRDITLVQSASTTSAPAVETSSHTAPGLDASTSSAPGVTDIADLALQPGVFPLARPAPLSRPASNRWSASTPPSALGATTSTPGAAPTASATASGPGAAPTIFPGLRDNWVADPWGMPPRSPMVRFPGLEALGGNGMPAFEASATAPRVAPSAIVSATAPDDSRSIPPSKRRRRDSAPDSGGMRDWADLPVDILEMVFVKRTGPILALAQVCHNWRVSAMAFPRPLVLCPAHSGRRMELIVPTRVMPRCAHVSESVSVAAEGCYFSYITLPGLGSHAELRLIGGSTSLLLFIDDSQGSLQARRFVGPSEELPNALPETLLSINLPKGVAPHDIYYGIFVVDSSATSFHLVEEINKVKGLFVATKSSIIGVLVNGSRACSDWSLVKIPLLARQKERKFITAASFGGSVYFMDQTHRLLACSIDLFGDIHTDEVPVNIYQLLDQHIKVLKTWILHLSVGETVDDRLLCLRYEYNYPRSFRFACYDLVVGEDREDRRWRVRKELNGLCIFIGWAPGAQAFAYFHPEKIGLASGAIYDAAQGMQKYCLGKAYQYNAMPQLESLAWPFAVWIQQSFSIPYVPLLNLPWRAEDVADAVAKDIDN